VSHLRCAAGPEKVNLLAPLAHHASKGILLLLAFHPSLASVVGSNCARWLNLLYVGYIIWLYLVTNMAANVKWHLYAI
jgi:hypothetical protein